LRGFFFIFTGAAVGFCSIPLSENSGKNKFAPHYNVQSEGPVPQSSLELTPVKLLAPRGQRSTENNSEEKKQQIDCGQINLAQYFFSLSADQDMSADGLLGGEDSGSHKPGMIEVSPSERGPWTQVGLNYALGPAPWYMGNTTLASEIVVVEGVKHLIVRTLVQLSNDTDFFLDVRLCPDFLLEGGSGLDPIEVDVDETGAFVEEEVFEDERYQPLAGWGSAWPGHLLPTDPGHWSKRDLSAASPVLLQHHPVPIDGELQEFLFSFFCWVYFNAFSSPHI
jgi:vacuolar protein sorting-associated protein 13A/C